MVFIHLTATFPIILSLFTLRSKVKQIVMLFSIILVSCTHVSEYPGFTKTNSGIYFKLNRLGEDSRNPSPGDYITINISYKTLKDSVFFRGRRKILVQKPSYKGSIDECFMMMKAGENATFIIEAQPFFEITLNNKLPSFLEPGDKLKINVDLVDLQTAEEYKNEKKAFLNWINDLDAFEKEVLRQYIEKQEMNIQPIKNGLYKLKIKQGHGKQVHLGDTVIVHYEGKFLNGKFFDSTKMRNEPLGFIYGTEMQVVEGLEHAIGTMQEGEKSLFILPSDLAFGSEGSSTGIIPPYTSVIFEVELLKVN